MALVPASIYWTAISSTALLTHSYANSVAYERPIHTAILALLSSTVVLVGLRRFAPELFKGPTRQRTDYSLLPLDDLGGADDQNTNLSQESTRPTSTRWLALWIITAISALSVRLELLRRISQATECTISNTEIALPVIIVAYDWYRLQKTVNTNLEDAPDSSAYEALWTAIQDFIVRKRWRYIPSALLVSYGCYGLQYLWTPLNSTYICPVVTGETQTIPRLQWLSLALDALLVVALYEIYIGLQHLSHPGAKAAILYSLITAATTAIWLCAGWIVYTFKPEYRDWLTTFDLSLQSSFLGAAIGQALILSALCISVLHCIITYGVLYTTTTLTAVVEITKFLSLIWTTRRPYPPASATTTLISVSLICIGYVWLLRLRQMLGVQQQIQASRQIACALILFILLVPVVWKSAYVHYHPIDLLLFDAEQQHSLYVANVTTQATFSPAVALGQAVIEYERRHKMRPPPGFDIWFEYAQNRSAYIIHDFDQIHNDLLPFWATAPQDLRTQTWELVSNPWNEISGITIRNGNAAVQENVLPTHRWMLEGVAILINSFAQYLPDMDLAFNLNDESRVAVPYEILKQLKQTGEQQDIHGNDGWSEKRSEGWLPIPEHELTDTVLINWSFRNTFANFGSVGCPAGSMARRYPHISSQSHICAHCAAPHSLGPFLANWTLAADVCHQPDLAHLHGFYLSPAAFKTSNQLMPVFSQSKPHGYNDILYPSAWNYMDKIIYAPKDPSGDPSSDTYDPGHPDTAFSQKHNTLFWRGATSEGVSAGEHTWRGMARQRLVHLTNNLTTTQHDYISVLLPDPSNPSKYKYQTLAGPATQDLGLSTDVEIVDHIARCGGPGLDDCHDQEAEFALVPPTDFQAHWAYKYLFDLDGAGFSGRFLPFLQSHSLPFKTALFREWYDSRLTAWRHFVPIDIRLHGVWSTLAYFAGVNGTIDGRRVEWAGHEREGEMIAEEGRNWANKVLRKEDMEIYFFRLLLEWGRLTDDNRENLGFVVE